jgi:diguanylate cyclase (GGDEF)-like protein
VLATQQLTEFLSVVADRPDGPAAHDAAVACAARALNAEVAVLMIDEGVAAVVGLPAADVSAYAMSEVAAGRRTTLELGGETHAVTFATIGGTAAGVLVVGRREPAGAFSVEEVCLLRGMARVLELSLSSLHMLESERRYARENDRLLGIVEQRQRLFEQLTHIQREIGRHTPLDRILQIVTGACRELLGAELCSVNLVEPTDSMAVRMVAADGVPIDAADIRPVPLAAAGVSGLAVLGDELVMIDDYATSPIAVPMMRSARPQSVMAAPVHENGRCVGSITVGTFAQPREWDKPAQEMLKAFAEHVSLALTDAHAAESVNQAFLDSLTGLHSRALFLTHLEETLAAGTGVAVLLIDLDRFKIVNDALGHTAGDALLIAAADRIRTCLRDRDTAARLDGDEFAVLLPDVYSAVEAEPAAERILTRLREPLSLAGTEAYVSASVGIAFNEPGDCDAAQLMVHADLAMQQAKKHGKDRFELFEPAMQTAFQAAVELEADLRRAVLRHEFELRYQPIVHLRTSEITGVEALIRWQHPTRGSIPPLDFIPLAEETGMIVPIGEWVLREACAQVAEWNSRRAERPLTVSVNVSAVQLEQGGLPLVVNSALRHSGLPPERLILELTESLLVDHRPATLRRLEAIKALGVRLAIDDFGTGYSSLAYLRRFPVDIIKIDKSFVDDVVDEPTAAALTHGIIQLGQALQLSTIAEGIEHAGQLTSLAGGNCELGQGYFFAEPLTGADLGDLLFPAQPGPSRRPEPGA